MFKDLPTLQHLFNQLRRIPYLASKNLYRVAVHFLRSDRRDLELLCKILLEARENIRPCVECFNWAEKSDRCLFCLDKRRDKSQVCVVESWHDLFAIERVGGYQGLYHVLGGFLSPLEGVGPDDLFIEALFKRLHSGEIKELIVATNPTPEGEATARFIVSRLQGTTLIISRLASGLPTGASLEYMDRTTIYNAFQGRQPF